MFENFKPYGDRVLVKRKEDQEKSAGGIIIPDAAKEKAQMGAVLAVGSGKKDNLGNVVSPQVKVGDWVYFGKYAGTEVDKEHLIIKEDELLGIMQK